MTKVRIIALAIAALVAAPAAHAQDAAPAAHVQDAADGGWNTPYGLIFTLQNVFQNQTTVGDYAGGVGIQKNLGPQRALRVSVNLARASDSGYETKTTNLATGQVQTTYTQPGPFTSRYEVGVGAMYMMRLSPSKISPYLGFGGGVSYVQQARKFENGTSAITVLNVNDMHRDLALLGSGALGVEWRVHKSVSIFAEYGLQLGLATYNSDKYETSNTDKATGAVSGTKSEGSSTRFLTWDTGIGQGGQLGLVAFF